MIKNLMIKLPLQRNALAFYYLIWSKSKNNRLFTFCKHNVPVDVLTNFFDNYILDQADKERDGECGRSLASKTAGD